MHTYIFVDTGSDRPALRYLHRYVITSVASKWHDIGLELMDIGDEHELNALEAEPNDTERAKKMFNRWLEKKHDASWSDLIEVLKFPHIGLYTLANDIEGKLLSESMCNVLFIKILGMLNDKLYSGIYG